jgi:predicted RND superfamily exporter protein
MKKMLGIIVVLAVLVGGQVFADKTAVPANKDEVISIHSEILVSAKEVHALVGKNLELRTQILDLHKTTTPETQKDIAKKVKPLKEQVKQNRKKIQELRKAIKAKAEKVKAMMPKGGKEKPEDETIGEE